MRGNFRCNIQGGSYSGVHYIGTSTVVENDPKKMHLLPVNWPYVRRNLISAFASLPKLIHKKQFDTQDTKQNIQHVKTESMCAGRAQRGANNVGLGGARSFYTLCEKVEDEQERYTKLSANINKVKREFTFYTQPTWVSHMYFYPLGHGLSHIQVCWHFLSLLFGAI